MTKHVSIERELPHFYCFKLHKLIHKTRYRNHLLKSQRIEKDKHEIQTRLESKKENRQFTVSWAIVKQIPAGKNGKRKCTLCLKKNLMIMSGRRSKNILSRRFEMLSKCRHVIKHHYFRCYLWIYVLITNLPCQSLKTVNRRENQISDSWSLPYAFTLSLYLTISSSVSVRMPRYWARRKFEEHERGVRVETLACLDIRTVDAWTNLFMT